VGTVIAAPTSLLQHRRGQPWLVAAGSELFWSAFGEFEAQFRDAQPRQIMLAEPNPVQFLAAFFAAVQQPCQIWLANPYWGAQEWLQVTAQCQPDWVVGGPSHLGLQSFHGSDALPGLAMRSRAIPGADTGLQILIPTGGSSGNIRFAAHTWETLAASVQGFCQHFDCDRVNAYCVLPLHHVSGLMQAMRCWLLGGQLIVQPFRKLLQGRAIAIPPHQTFLSLVPTQLQRLLGCDWPAATWLQSFSAILLGGAPPWPSLLAQARALHLPIAPTYGMTETASQVATLLPQEFLAGQTGSGRSLPHAHLTIQDDTGNPLPPDQIGQITVKAPSLALAVGDRPIEQPLQTGDWGYLDSLGVLHVMGRRHTMIMTGGEKVLPEEVEAVMLASGLVRDAAVVGIPDGDWGERVVAVVVPRAAEDIRARLHTVLKSQLSSYKVPKQWWTRSALPRNAQGKLNRTALKEWVMAQEPSIGVTTGLEGASGDGADGL
jgi:O-succinylbenzoic acid--CoA ligase